MFWHKKRDEKFRTAYEEAFRLFQNTKTDACRELMEPWSKKGYTEATALIARTYRVFYDMAKKGPKKDEFRQGYLEYLERGAKQGDADAQFKLGAAYEFPESMGLPMDMEKALHYYELSAEHNSNLEFITATKKIMRRQGCGIPKHWKKDLRARR